MSVETDLSEYELVGFYQGLPFYAHVNHRSHPVTYRYLDGVSIAVLDSKENKMASQMMGMAGRMPMSTPAPRPKPKRRKVKATSKVAGKSSRTHGR